MDIVLHTVVRLKWLLMNTATAKQNIEPEGTPLIIARKYKAFYLLSPITARDKYTLQLSTVKMAAK